MPPSCNQPMPASGSGASSAPTHNHRLSWSDGMSASGASPCTSRGSRHHCSPYLGAAHSWRQRSSARLRMSHASPMSPLSRVSRASVRFRCGRAALRARCVTAQPAIGKSNTALHRIALTQIMMGGPGAEYYRKRIDAGDRPAMARRCLKRHLARVVYRRMLNDKRTITNGPT